MPDPNVPDAFAVLADRVGGDGIYTSNAALVVYKLVGGDFDPKDAITHGYIDSQMLPAWRTTNASLADFGGMPSAAIEGSYRDNNMSLNTARRNTIAVAGHGQVPRIALGHNDSRRSGPHRERHRGNHQRVQDQCARRTRCRSITRGRSCASSAPVARGARRRLR